jgi:probable rRNA maturation factor
MKLTLINRTKTSVAATKINSDLAAVIRHLKKKLPEKILPKLQQKQLTVVFMGRAEARVLNRQYRDRDYATDVLSFPGQSPLLGELVFCLPVLKDQAKSNKHSLRLEFIYMLIHGILHLLGYDHESSKKEAQKMFRLQDSVFLYFQMQKQNKNKLVDY